VNNYLPTANPFNLAAPPAWFLQRLYAYDAAIVIFPSVKEPLYRIGRRGRNGHGLLNTLKGNPDTKIFVDNRLWPWKSILPTAVGADWNRILMEIPQYDTQRHGDPATRLDDLEAAQEAAEDRRMASELDAMGHSSYNLFKMMEGSRVGFGSRPEGAGYRALPAKKRAGASRSSTYRPTGAGEGAIFVGR
jgi:hypothetical protein